MMCPHCKKRFLSHPTTKAPIRDKVFAVLDVNMAEEDGEGLTATEIALELEMPRKRVSRSLEAYEQAGLVRRNGFKMLPRDGAVRGGMYPTIRWVRADAH